MKLLGLFLVCVAVANASVTVTRTSDDARHPSTMEIEVLLPESNKKVLIPLTRTDAFEDVPMTVLDDGVSRTFSSRQVHHDSHSHYRDIESKSVISVRESNGNRQISGHVMHEGTSYFLEPVGDSDHRVTKNEMNPEVMAKQIDVGQYDIQSRRKRQTNTAATTLTVEISLLLDDTVWNAFRTMFGDESKALTELHYYYTHILNGIDTAYRNIRTLSISVKCIGITIAKSAADSSWMPGSLDGGQILTQIQSYIRGKTADHFMAFTRKDITGDGSSSVCGMAPVSGTCTDRRVSINEDQGLQSWGTAAHELGHNLGSNHDGAGNSCSQGSKNLMSPSTQIYSLADVANSYRFSQCTIDSITKYVNGLATNCLKTTEGSRVTQLSQNIREGARLTLDQVCKMSYPNSVGKFMVTSSVSANPAEICASIYCQMSSTGGSTSGGLRAPVGTPCGSQKSCNWNGECTADSQTPSINMSCFFGDTNPPDSCQNFLKTISSASAANKASYCQQVKSACCKTLASVCP